MGNVGNVSDVLLKFNSLIISIIQKNCPTISLYLPYREAFFKTIICSK